MTERTGSCLCGQVRYRLAAEPVKARICWCCDCQHIASNGTVNAIFLAGAITITGNPSGYTSTAATIPHSACSSKENDHTHRAASH